MPQPPSPESERSLPALARELALLQAVLDSTEEGLLKVAEVLLAGERAPEPG